MANGLIIAAPHSGAGKTTVTIGLLRLLARHGVKIAPAKIGPDYIDPQFHEFASHCTSYNIDGWAMRGELIEDLISSMATNTDLLLIEGVMGLYDGAVFPGQFGHGATSDIARLLNLPVILIVDCARMGQSVAAMVQGFSQFDPTVKVAGVILNKLGSERHTEMMLKALKGINIPVVGAVPRSDVMDLPARHLGLVQASEIKELDQQIEAIADHIGAHIDLKSLQLLSKPIEALQSSVCDDWCSILPGEHLAIARDDAFRFLYPHHIFCAKKSEQKISYFSPLKDEGPDVAADAVYLPGGYPELFAEQLGGAYEFKKSVREAADVGKTIYGECGGYMVLGDRLIDRAGQPHEMIGLLDLVTSFKQRKLTLGYRHVERHDVNEVERPKYRAHEFHYSTIERQSGPPLFRDLQTQAETSYGLSNGSVSGSFMHLIDHAQLS